MSKKIRHHILPIFYLTGFIDPRTPPFIWLYEKGEPLIQKRSPKNIAVRKHYHSFVTTEVITTLPVGRSSAVFTKIT